MLLQEGNAAEVLRKELCNSKSATKIRRENSAYGRGESPRWTDQRSRKSQILSHIEKEIFAAGRGEYDRTHLLLAALLERAAVAALLNQSDARTLKNLAVMRAMIQHARETLEALNSAGTRKSRNHLAFEAVLRALVPDNAAEQEMLLVVSELLGVDRKALRRVSKGKCDDGEDEEYGCDEFISVLHSPRKRRKDFIQFGRQVHNSLGSTLLEHTHHAVKPPI